jgi:hypothetical protein
VALDRREKTEAATFYTKNIPAAWKNKLLPAVCFAAKWRNTSESESTILRHSQLNILFF